MRSEVEDLGSGAVSSADGRLVEVVEAGGVSLRPVGEVEVDEVVTGGLGCAREDVPAVVVKDYRWILDPSKLARISFRADQRAAGTPAETTGESGSGSNCVGGWWPPRILTALIDTLRIPIYFTIRLCQGSL